MATAHSLEAQLWDIKAEADELPFEPVMQALREVPAAEALETLKAMRADADLRDVGRTGVADLAARATATRNRLVATLRETGNPNAIVAVRGLDGVMAYTGEAAQHCAQAQEALDRMNHALGVAALAAEEAAAYVDMAARQLQVADGQREVFDRNIIPYVHTIR